LTVEGLCENQGQNLAFLIAARCWRVVRWMAVKILDLENAKAWREKGAIMGRALREAGVPMLCLLAVV
jgi:hypothetical protein